MTQLIHVKLNQVYVDVIPADPATVQELHVNEDESDEHTLALEWTKPIGIVESYFLQYKYQHNSDVEQPGNKHQPIGYYM